MRTKNKALSVLVLLAIAAGAGCKKTVATTDQTITATVPVRATQVKPGYVEDLFNVTGRTRAIHNEKIYAPIAGRIIEMTVVEGTAVAKGDVIARVETKESIAAVEGARVLAAQASGESEKATAERMLKDAEQSVTGVAVRASIGGRIDTKSANLGEYLAEGQEMVSIIDPSSTAFIANVPLGDLGKIRIGMTARVVLPGLSDQILAARVFAIKSRVVAESQSAEVILTFDHLTPQIVNSLRADVNGTASFVLSSHSSALVVPKSALLRNDETNTYTIMTFGPDSISHPIDVERGPSHDSSIEISGPNVEDGMNVITEGGYAMPDSTRITLLH